MSKKSMFEGDITYSRKGHPHYPFDNSPDPLPMFGAFGKSKHPATANRPESPLVNFGGL